MIVFLFLLRNGGTRECKKKLYVVNEEDKLTYLNDRYEVTKFGSSGSKKSREFAIPNGIELAQEELQKKIKREMSLVFTDPKGELYRKLTKYLETKGYVKEIIKTKRPCYICTYPPIEIVDRIN